MTFILTTNHIRVKNSFIYEGIYLTNLFSNVGLSLNVI